MSHNQDSQGVHSLVVGIYEETYRKEQQQAHGNPLVQSHKTQDQLQTGDNLQRARFDSRKLIQDTGRLEAALGKNSF